MRVKVDENLPEEVADLLRSVGHDALTVAAQGMTGDSDAELAATVAREDRALLTLDLDFADIRTYPPEQHAGLIVLRLTRQDKLRVLETMRRFLPLLAEEDVRGHLWIVEEEHVRIRP